MKSERLVLGVVLVFLVGFCSFSYVSAEDIIFEQTGPSEEITESSDEINNDEKGNEKTEKKENKTKDEELEPVLLIKAVSAGGKNSIGELIELINFADEPLMLDDVLIRYTNASGKESTVYRFDDGLKLIGRNLLLRYSSAEDSKNSDLTYSTDLAQVGGEVAIVADGEVIDSVCWGSFKNCAEENIAFNSKKPTTLVRNLIIPEDPSLGEKYLDSFSHVADYEPEWEEGRVVLEASEQEIINEENKEDREAEKDEKEIIEPVCQDLEFSEIFTYFEAGKTKQFIEFFNPSAEKIVFDGCYLEYKTSTYELSGEIESGQYFVFYPDPAITKNPTKSNTIILHDVDDSAVDYLTYFNGQKKDASFAKFINDDGLISWQQTYALTPGEENIYQRFRTCEEGKIINEATGKCIQMHNDEDEKNEEEKEAVMPICAGIQFSEILSFYENEQSEQFIEFYNSTADEINLKGCNIRYKNKLYALNGTVDPEKYFVYFPSAFTLTKNPTSSNKIELIDVDGSIADSLTYFNGQKKAVSFAQFGTNKDGSEIWDQTYSPTPGEENNFQRFKTCEAGKVINEETGNCVKITTVETTIAECSAGSYRNPLTNRCKKYSTTSSVLKACSEGYERNPLTNRCRKIESSETTLKECAEGYERNPETNRCRKIVNNDGADYEIQSENFEEQSSFVALWAIAAVASLGALYIIFEYRKEIAGVFKKKK